MKLVNIYLTCNYEYSSNIGKWAYYLNYKRAVIKRYGTVKNAGSVNRTLLFALYQALNHIKEPCEIEVFSKTSLGFNHPKKSPNKDLIGKILTMVNKAGHVIKFTKTDDFGMVEIWEQVYGTPICEDKHKDKTTKPDIKNKKTPNDVFSTTDKGNEPEMSEKEIEEQKSAAHDWREMYSDLMSESQGSWVPGSGGY